MTDTATEEVPALVDDLQSATLAEKLRNYMDLRRQALKYVESNPDLGKLLSAIKDDDYRRYHDI